MSNATDCQSLTDEWSSLCSSIMKLAAESLVSCSPTPYTFFHSDIDEIRFVGNVGLLAM